MITTEFLYAGKASYLVRNPKGDRVTVRLTKSKPDPRFPESYFVSVRDGAAPWAYVGAVRRASSKITPTFKSVKGPAVTRPIAVAEWSLNLIQMGGALPTGYVIEHTGRCGRCAKLLTDAESIATGLGPVCRGNR